MQRNSQISQHIITKVPQIYYVKFFLLALIYGFNGTTYTSVPFVFYRSKLNCIDQNDNIYSCSNEDACSNIYGYKEQTEYPQINSIVSFLDLYCDRKIIEAWILTLGQFGKLFAYVTLVFYPVSTKYKEKIIYFTNLLSGVVLISLDYIQDTQMFIFAYFLWNYNFSIMYGLIYNHLTDDYPFLISEHGSAYVNTSWPIIMVFFIGFSYIFGTWQNILIHFSGYPLLIFSLSCFGLKYYMDKSPEHIQFTQLIQQERQNIESNKAVSTESQNNETGTQSLKENYKALQQNSTLRQNFIIWSLCWACNGICYVGCYFSLNTLKGNLYLNSFMSTIFEVFASILAVVLVKKMNLKNVIISTYSIIGFAFVSCIFISQDMATIESFVSLAINLSPIVIAKVSYEIMWTVLIKYQSTVFESKYHQIQFSVSCMFSMIICNGLAFYKYFMESINLSPFFGYGLFSLLCAYYSTKFIELNSQPKKDSLYTPLKQSNKYQNIELSELYETTQKIQNIHV